MIYAQSDHIYLLGYMGAGKSTCGRLLAQKLGLPFIDTDVEIEKEQAMPVESIFSNKGESFFRKLESGFLDSIKDRKKSVIATGGGMPCARNNLFRIQNTGISIYIQLSPESLSERIWKEKNKRPLVTRFEEQEEMTEYIRSHLAEREAYYSQADYLVNGEQKPEKVISDILKLMGLVIQ